MRRLAVAVALLATACAHAAAPPAPAAVAPAAAPAARPAPQTAEERTRYAVGLMLARSVEVFGFSQEELETVLQGLRDAAQGRPAFALDQALQEDVQALARARRGARAGPEKARGLAYRDEAARRPGAVRTESGLVYIPIREGSGPQPASTDKVKVHYTGRLMDGTTFDSSEQRGPATFGLAQVVRCWTEGVARMRVGGKARLVCPPELAYGDNGAGQDIPPGATLDFEVELLEVVK